MTPLDTGAKLVRKTVDGKELDLKDKEGEVFCRVVRAFPAPLVSPVCLLLSLLSLCLARPGALTAAFLFSLFWLLSFSCCFKRCVCLTYTYSWSEWHTATNDFYWCTGWQRLLAPISTATEWWRYTRQFSGIACQGKWGREENQIILCSNSIWYVVEVMILHNSNPWLLVMTFQAYDFPSAKKAIQLTRESNCSVSWTRTCSAIEHPLNERI